MVDQAAGHVKEAAPRKRRVRTSRILRKIADDKTNDRISIRYLLDTLGDRAIAPHDANLFDMGQKYADLMTGAEAIERMRNIG